MARTGSMVPVTAFVLVALMAGQAQAGHRVGRGDPFSSWLGTYEGGCTQYAYTMATSATAYTFKCSPMPITNPFKVVLGRTRSGGRWQYTYSNQYYRAEITDLNGKAYLSDAGAVNKASLSWASANRHGKPFCADLVSGGSKWRIQQTIKKVNGVYTYVEYAQNYITPRNGMVAECPKGKWTLGCDESNGGYFYSYCTAWKVSDSY